MFEIARWLETDLFSDWGIAYDFKHVLPLGKLNISLEADRSRSIAPLLCGISSEHGNLERTLQTAFQGVYGLEPVNTKTSR